MSVQYVHSLNVDLMVDPFDDEVHGYGIDEEVDDEAEAWELGIHPLQSPLVAEANAVAEVLVDPAWLRHLLG